MFGHKGHCSKRSERGLKINSSMQALDANDHGFVVPVAADDDLIASDSEVQMRQDHETCCGRVAQFCFCPSLTSEEADHMQIQPNTPGTIAHVTDERFQYHTAITAWNELFVTTWLPDLRIFVPRQGRARSFSMRSLKLACCSLV